MLGVVATADTLPAAIEKAYANVEKVHFCGPASKASEKTDTAAVNTWVNDIPDEELPFE